MAAAVLTPAKRADLLLRLLARLFEMDWNDIDVILTSFGLDGLDLDGNPDYATAHSQCRSSLQAADANTLQQLAAYVLGSDWDLRDSEVPGSGSADDLWGDGIARVFLSHLATEKAFVAEISEHLAGIQVCSFVAHDTIDVSREWQADIERALGSADVLVGLAHPGFHNSYWTQQEVGWALGRNLPVLMIGLGETPQGFPARYQSPMLSGPSAWKVASTIAVWLTRDERWRDEVVGALVHDLQDARSFVAGEAAAKRLSEVGKLTPAVLDAIEQAYLSNDQLYPNHIGARVVEQILQNHNRKLPRDQQFIGPKRR
jgi:hypothetical protein